MNRPRRIAVISTTCGCGKTTLGEALADRLGARFIELDALVQGPGWTETPDDALRATLLPLLAEPAWVVDGNYRNKLGDFVVSRADVVVWLDLPVWVWLPRLIRRSLVRAVRREVLWNGNRESLKGALWGRDSLVAYALRHAGPRRAAWPTELARYPVVRLTSTRQVDRFLRGVLGHGRPQRGGL
ncbi:MAG: adenylate kinase [Deltaproteobacteria bacterium HGW-Deltaproteobacteria-14]|jgi:adenylate kinase family enzyme|nr:MAG: adenylate kinase [Deltaproteobacteria bacterium HGW-Deltaproteobacteria-14]